jgi:hypothetical protein
LIRGGTASNAYQSLVQKWSASNSSIKNQLGNYFKDSFNKLFGGLIPVGQPKNTKFRGDDGAYGLMIGSKQKFKYYSSTGTEYNWGINYFQRWEAGSGTVSPTEAIRKNKETKI